MRSWILPGALVAAALFPSACGSTQVAEVGLGKVVVYRNGVAYYERRAKVVGDHLLLTVPREQVDDFLKSLKVTDESGKSLPVSFPSSGGTDRGDGLIDMAVRLPADAPTNVVLTYITEAPAWKPSYRIDVTKEGQVQLEGWAIVDNTSGETWEDVLVGVGSSSALSFRYDLWSIRDVHRQTLSREERFAVAPPTGQSTYRENAAKGDKAVVADLSSEQINDTRVATTDDGEDDANAPMPSAGAAADAPAPTTTVEEFTKRRPGRPIRLDGAKRKELAERRARLQREQERRRAERQRQQQLYQRNERIADQLAARLKNNKQPVVIEGYAKPGEASPMDRSLQRANTMRNSLIQRGVAPGLLKVRGVGVVEGRPAGVRLVADRQAQPKDAAGGAKTNPPGDAPPVGESHFTSGVPLTVPRGTSTMVSIVKAKTKGEIVYLYDAESTRGNHRYAFRAVRLENPTDNTLEAGPVTVYGEDRFIGEGLTDPIPPRSMALVPFALDRQVVVEKKLDRRDQIAGLVKLQRGMLTTEIKHVRDTTLKLTNRFHLPVTVYVRHSVVKGWELEEAPSDVERIGSAYIFPVKIAAGKTRTLEIREATPLVKTMDLRSDETVDLVEAYLTRSSEHAELAEKMKPLWALNRKMADHRNAIRTLREQMNDYRARMDELHGQIVTLKAVRTGGELMRHLKKKLTEISERVQKATIQVVTEQEELMLTRIKFQDAIAELSLDGAEPATAARK